MDLITHLRSFVAVADAGTFTAAAIELRVPQPVVSRRVMALEEHLGSTLFVRAGRRTHLSDAGRRLLPHATDLVARADRFIGLATGHAEERLRIGVPVDVEVRALGAASTVAAKAGFALDIVFAPPAARQEQLAAGDLDLAFLDAATDAADIAVLLGAGSAPPVTGGVVHPADAGPQQADRRPLHLDELRRSRTGPNAQPRTLFLCPEDDVPAVRQMLGRRLARAGLSPGQFQIPDSAAAALTRVYAEGGVVLCAESFAQRHGLSWRPLGGAQLPRCYAVAPGQRLGRRRAVRELVRGIMVPLQDAVGGLSPDRVDYVSPRSLAPAVLVGRG